MNNEELKAKIDDINEQLDLVNECDKVYNELLKIKQIEDRGNK